MNEKLPVPNPPNVKELEVQLLERYPNLFNGVSNTKKNKILNSLKDLIVVEVRQEVTQLKSFSGPVPPPDVLAKYIQINPEFATLIVNMAVDEQKYAHNKR